ncbi:MAG: response regulator [Synergistaceae bacterium]|jgi:signal transduction histidine kinase/DNA-binding response OmpR family regulator/HPt (histidine-containing phosphotransfer) domain-containing protein|nr:response regulator [Synergistaceae bacterium]
MSYSSGGNGELNGKDSRIESLERENTLLQSRINKLDRQAKAQQNVMYRYEQMSFIRDRMAVMLNAERARQEKYLEMMLATIQDLIILCDRNECVAYCSDSFLEAAGVENFGLVQGKFIKEVLLRFGDADFVQRSMNRLKLIKTQRRSLGNVVEVINHEHNGRRFYAIHTNPLFDKFGVFDGYLIVCHDTTELLSAKDAAEAANKAKSAFLATMSHEIRTPLNAIMGLSEIELQKRLLPDNSSNLEKIYNAGSILLGIVNDVLDISKIEVGNFELICTNYDAARLINDVVQLNIVRMASKRISFVLEVDETFPARLWGDELRVKQILNNLLSNAFKYTQEGRVSLRIEWERADDDVRITFTVSDTGIGIKPEDMSKLFTEYTQLNARANRDIEGTGLGLSIAKRLCTMMGGSITVESEYGVGSDFSATILQKTQDGACIGREAADNLKNFDFTAGAASRVKHINRTWMPYGRVLVVDDVETNLDVARGLMIPYGLEIDCVRSGSEAIERVKEIGEGDGSVPKYDVIFMDHMMPEMDGIEATRAIRSEIGTSYAVTVPIVVLTANALAGNEEMFLAHGFNGFIPKPMDINRLDMALNHFIRDKQNEETLREAERAVPDNRPRTHTEKILRGLEIDGVDVAAGRKIYEDDSAYLDVLRSYTAHAPDIIERLRDPSRENLGDYVIAVHGIKGASRGISAGYVADKAEALEAAARNGNFGFVGENNDELIASATALAENIEKALEDLRNGESGKDAAHEPDEETLDKMLEAVRSYDTKAMETTLAELERYRYKRGEELIKGIRIQLEKLEYDEIAYVLEEWTRRKR